MLAAQPAAPTDQYTQIDLIDRLLLRRLRVRNTVFLVVETGDSYVPGGAFAPRRVASPIALGPVRLGGNDVIEVSARLLESTDVDGWILSAAAPFLPERARTGPERPPARPHVYLGSARTLLPYGEPASVRIVANEPGVLDLDSLQVVAGLDAYAPNYAADVLSAVAVVHIELPSGEGLVVGAPRVTPRETRAPAAVFDHTRPGAPWARLGPVALSEGDYVDVVLMRLTDETVTPDVYAVVGARFHPDSMCRGMKRWEGA